tara:strand:+ start:1656 stop:1955 length:300 start_codon:yes stop_codon:yes gene_type:complete
MAKNFKMVDGKLFELTNEEEKQLLIKQENYEKDFSDVRLRRNRLLQETDWIVIREREQAGSVHNFEAFMKYRQELRDIPTKYNKVSLVKWPTKPEIDLG